MQKIEHTLERGNASECLAWCSENRFNLKRTKSILEFSLRKQEFIELARRRDLMNAIAYTRKHFGQWWDTNAREIEQVSALLAIGPDTKIDIYRVKSVL